MTRLRLLAVALFALAVTGSFAGSAPADRTLVIIKRAVDTNPGIFLADFQGPDEIRQRLQRTLTQCDWFTVVASPRDATYVLRAAYTAAPAPCLDMEVTGGKSSVTRFRQTTASARPGWVVYQAVDTLIQKLFTNPGLCASTLAFANGSRGYKELFTCNFDGTDARQLTFNRSISTEPSWGPRGTSLVYTLYHDNVTDVVLADLVNRRHRPISQFPGLNAGAALSPDGQWAALCLSRDRKVELYVLRVANHAALRLTSDAAVESSPTWSPDGTRICFVSDRAGKPRLYLIAARGGTATALPRAGGAESVSPDWSRVSNKVCFATGGGANYQIAIIDMANPGAGAQVIQTVRGGSYEAPSWAPDGRHVVATRQTDSKRELCMVDTCTGKVTLITTAGDFSLPSWSDVHN